WDGDFHRRELMSLFIVTIRSQSLSGWDGDFHWTDRRSQFETLLTETMAMDRAGSPHSTSTIGDEGPSSSGSPPIDATGGDMEFGTSNTSSSGPGGRSGGD
ncbi:MAG: hypothetical protein ACPL1K_01365, partial [Candidatus Kryptoniota bacterium]